MSNHPNHGSIKKLNWRTPTFSQKVTKSVSHDEQIAAHQRQGTPITKAGGFNGATSNLIPAIPDELNPKITLNKAVLQPVKYGPGGPVFQRKRDPSGKFSSAQDSGKESTAEEDKQQQAAAAELIQARQHNKMEEAKEARRPSRRQEVTQKAMGGIPQQVPGVSGETASMNSQNDNTSAQLGNTKTGKPVYDDPNHTQHSNYGPEDHQDAMNLNNDQAQQAQGQGDQVGAAKYSQNAKTHSDMINDGSAPGDRFMDNLFGPAQTPSMPPEGLNNGMDQGLGQDPSQMMGQGTSGTDQGAMGQDPLGDPNAQPPMGQSPMMGQQPPDMNNFMDLMGQEPPPPMGMGNGQPPMGQDPMMQQAPQGPSMSGQATMDPTMMPTQAPPMQPPQDPMNAFLGAPDQNKPMGAPPPGGPAPGMKHTATGGPVGPQTNPTPADGSFGTTDPSYDNNFGGGDPNEGLDLESLFETNGDENNSDDSFGSKDEEGGDDSNFDFGGSDEDDSDGMEDTDDSDGDDDNGFGGNGDSSNNDMKKLEATAKALNALRRYV